MPNYSKLNKAELLLVIEQLEHETIEARLRGLSTELNSLASDIYWLVRQTYNTGYRAGVVVKGVVQDTIKRYNSR